jgi:hypothetical protein
MRWNQGRATIDKLLADGETCENVLDEMSPF